MVSVITQHNDNQRTGANLNEVTLNTNNVNVQSFGKLFERQVDGEIYAQPLYAPQLLMADQLVHNVIFVATMHNSVFAFDADNPNANEPLWTASLGPSIPLPDANIGLGLLYHDIYREIGILGTPVIVPDLHAIYAVASTKENGDYHVRLHALDLSTGTEKFGGPVEVQGTVPGTGEDNVNGQVSFVAHRHNQRPGLLYVNGNIYIAFASYGDKGPYHGWVYAYNAMTLQQACPPFIVTPNGSEGGIWQAGQGLTADEEGNIYFLTGNGTFNENGTDLGDCVVKLGPDHQLIDWFSPHNNEALNAADMDLGSSGVMLIPGTELLLAGGKEGKLYLIDRTQLGRFNPHSDAQIVQCFRATGLPNAQGEQPPVKSHHIHGAPLYWNGPDGARMYLWGENDWLRAYSFDGQKFPVSTDVLWPDPKAILPETAIGKPSIANVNDERIAIAWTGADPAQHVNIESTGNGWEFANKVTLDETSIDGPAITFGNGRAFLSWTGRDAENRLNMLSSADCVTFENKITLDETSPFGPVLAFGNGQVFLAWTGKDDNRSLNVMSSTDGINFSNKVTLAESSNAAPGLSFVNGKLYLLWQGADPEGRLNILESTDGIHFSNKVTLDESSPFAPSLAFYNGTYYFGWTGNDLIFNHLNVNRGPTINSLENKTTFRDSAVASPPLLVFQNQLWMAWTGSDSPSHVNLASLFQVESRNSTFFAPGGMPGGMLAISANGSEAGSGIVWASLPFTGNANFFEVPGVLRAFDASDVSRELWNSKENELRDDAGLFAKFCPPTVANGKVYLATFSKCLGVYGLLG